MKMILGMTFLLLTTGALATSQISPFTDFAKEMTFEGALQILKVKCNADITKLQIFETETVDRPEVRTLEEMYSMTIRGTATNWFIPPTTILLGKKMAIHNLAHEMTHYIQYHCMGYDTPEDSYSDEAEDLAVWVQNHFR